MYRTWLQSKNEVRHGNVAIHDTIHARLGSDWWYYLSRYVSTWLSWYMFWFSLHTVSKPHVYWFLRIKLSRNLLRHLNLSNSTSMLPKAVGAYIYTSVLHEAIVACANECLRNRLDFFWPSAKSMVVTALAEEARLKYIHIVAAAAITSEALEVHAKNRK